MSWETFLKAHWGAIAATDFFDAEVFTRTGLVRYFVLFIIDLKTRRVEIAGIMRQPEKEWMSQIARNLTDCGEWFLKKARYLIHDRDPLFTRSFRGILECLKLPARAPPIGRADAIAPEIDRARRTEPESFPIQETDPGFDFDQSPRGDDWI